MASDNYVILYTMNDTLLREHFQKNNVCWLLLCFQCVFMTALQAESFSTLPLWCAHQNTEEVLKLRGYSAADHGIF